MLGLTTLLMVALVTAVSAKNRVYYVAAVDVEWDYAPSGIDLADAASGFEHTLFLPQGDDRIGHIYNKTIYKRYTNSDYNTEIPNPAWMGILGPVLKGEIGDTIIVHFKNLASRHYTMHPHGVHYDKESEGALYSDNTAGADRDDDAVPPGQSHTYMWMVRENFGPTKSDPNCIIWAYHSHVIPPKDTDSGLVGPIVTCKKGTLNDDGTRKDGVEDRYIFVKIFEESNSWHWADNMQRCGMPEVCQQLQDDKDFWFLISNQLFAINGMVFGNLPPIDVCANSRVAVHMLGLGSLEDLHAMHINGQTLVYHNKRVVTLPMFSASFKTSEMVPTVPGRWLISCQNEKHYDTGMNAFLDVEDCGIPPMSDSQTPIINERVYYIMAGETAWNYAPSGMDLYEGVSLQTPGPRALHYSQAGNRIGGTYIKALYYEFTDNTFTTKKERTGTDVHLGFLGPVIRGEVGDEIRIEFWNNASIPCSVSAKGVVVDKDNEGSKYEDGDINAGDVVSPGGTHTYRWTIPQSAGPTKYDAQCNTNIYQSSVSQSRGALAGLIGPLLVCKKDSLDENGQQRRIDKEFILLVQSVAEFFSLLYQKSIDEFAEDPDTFDKIEEPPNWMPNINGFGYANLPGLEACIGGRISWHLIGMGSDEGSHPVYFRGNSLTSHNHNGDTFAVFPATTLTALMVPDNPGIWGITCGATNHFADGESALYSISTCGKRAKKKKVPTATLR